MGECKRGFVPQDEKDFNQHNQSILRKAQKDLQYLINQGYPMKTASTFIGNHYLLSERQRLAITRATAPDMILTMRREKQKNRNNIGRKVEIDGLNVIITLEVALSRSTLIHCMDGTMRDLAGLRGTYRIIDKTDTAILLIGDKLKELQIKEAVFYLDTPVSNTGRLSKRILELLGDYPFRVSAELVYSPDRILEHKENVITQDAIILNRCISWYNFTAEIIQEKIPDAEYVELGLRS